jgi:hypothetical protein
VDLTFWLGAGVGAIFGLLLQLLARPLNRYFDFRVERRAERQSARLKEAIVSDRAAIRDWLVLQLIEIALITALAGVVAGLAAVGGNWLAAYVVRHPNEARSVVVYSQVMFGFSQVVGILGAVLILRIALGAISAARLTITLPKADTGAGGGPAK